MSKLKSKAKSKKSVTKIELDLDTYEILKKSPEFYENQINRLETELKKYQNAYGQTRDIFSRYDTQINSFLEDKKDIFSFLTKELQSKTDEISKLKINYAVLNQSKINNKELQEQIYNSQKKSYEEKLNILQNQNLYLESKLTANKDFLKEKETLQIKLENFAREVSNLKLSKSKEIFDLESSFIDEKDKLKDTMMIKLQEVSEAYQQLCYEKMNKTTKNVIKKNCHLNSVIKRDYSEIKQLFKENQSLRNDNQKLKLDVKTFKLQEGQLAECLVITKQKLKVIQEKFKALNLSKSSHTSVEEVQILKRNNDKLTEELAKLKSDSISTQPKEECPCKLIYQKTFASKEKLKEVLKQTSTILIENFNKMSLSDKKRIRDELSMIELLISQLETQIIKQNLTFKPFIPN